MPARLLFVAAAFFCLTPWASPGLALVLGMLLALTLENPFLRHSRPAARWLLQASVVLLGFGMNLGAVARAGERGLVLAFLTITGTFLLGALLARWLRIPARTSALISAGTAICGGSAIAAVSVVVDAAEAEMSVAMGCVFLLNAVALFAFPRLGHLLGLNQVQFGTWAGMAIHDISSVVGAASQYGLVALQTATAVKLSRALWIVPVALLAGWKFAPAGEAQKAARKIQVPWFIGLFLLASLARTLVAPLAAAGPTLSRLAVIGLTLTLFLIGAGLSRATLRAVGVRPMVQALLLWLAIGAGSLAAVRWLG
ncbi:MAG TPA: putative sulfate exporter family transporter [Terriglobales bacterium]|nr:putative sulfate exporter family transporter [Terriglobales bacterium]